MFKKRLVNVIVFLLALCCAAFCFVACQDGIICNHKYELYTGLGGGVISEATCISGGEYRYKCTLCGDEKIEKGEPDPTKHKWNEGVVEVEPTCTQKGSELFECTLCGATKTETIYPRHKEVPFGERKEPTCTESGLTAGTVCSVCKMIVMPQMPIEPHGHAFISDVCYWCGEERDYTVQYRAFGEVVKEITVKASELEKLEHPEIPQKPGYKNLRWEEPRKINGEAVIELHAELIDYTIKYNNLENGVHKNPETFTVEDDITFMPASRNGYAFKGWYSYEENGGEIKETKIEKIAGYCDDIELTAKWEIITYKIEYANYKTADMSAFPTEYTVETETFELGSISVTGYTFNGWKFGGHMMTKVVKGTYGDLLLRADLTGDKYTVTLDANGGRVTNDTYNVEYGSDYRVSVPTLSGYEFIGWYDGVSDTAKRYAAADGWSVEKYDVLDNITLYAHWEKIRITVTFDSTGGTAVAKQKYDYGDTLVLPEAPTKQGYTFDGWYSQDGQKEFTASTIITESITVYAKWLDSIAISDKDGLIAIAQAPDKNYHLTADIDLRGTVWTPVDDFTGTLNGKGYAIKNFVLSTTKADENFGFVCINNGTIKDVTFLDYTCSATRKNSNGSFTLQMNVGTVAGLNNGIIKGVTLRSGKVITNFDDYRDSRSQLNLYVRVGGIAGLNAAGASIYECSSNLPIEAALRLANYNSSSFYVGTNRWLYGGIGGIAGYSNGSIYGSVYDGKITTNASSGNITYGGGYGTETANINAQVGGMVGWTDGESAVRQCYSTGEFILTNHVDNNLGHNYGNIGALIGLNRGKVYDSFTTGTVTADASDGVHLGGLIGQNASGGDVKSSYSSVSISTDSSGDIGGFCGTNEAVIQNSFATGTIVGNIDPDVGSVNAGGLVGKNASTGSVSKCFSSGSVSATNGNTGPLIGDNVGIALNSYYMRGSSVVMNGEYVDPGTNDNIKPLPFNKLWSEDFLINTMYWDSEGWVILTDESPMLEWEIAVGHNFVTQVSEPDCEHGGFTVYSCDDCGKIFVRNFIAPKGHSYEVVRTVAPACNAEGYTVKKCSVCNDEMHTDFIDPTGHPNSEVSVKSDRAATCTEQGITVYHCDACNNDFSVTTESTGHDGTLVSTTTQPTCTEQGEAVYHCGVCDNDYTVTLDCIAHSWIDVKYNAPTCGIVLDDDGNIIARNPESGNEAGRKCEVCGFVDYGCEEIAPHIFELVSVTTEATCTHAGLGSYKCKTCELEQDIEIAQLAHADEDKNFICDTCEQLLFTEDVLSSFTKITDVEGLRSITNNPSKNYWLDADIDLADEDWTAIGTADRPFRGIFFGDNHTISGMRFEVQNYDQTVLGGLFGYNSGTVLCVKIADFVVDVKNVDIVFGGVAAYNNGTVKNCVLDGNNLIYTYVKLTVNDYAAHKVDSDGSIIGGLVGINKAVATVENCSVVGSITAYISNISEVQSAKLSSSIMSLIKSTSAETVQHITLGGVVGRNEGKVTGCEVSGLTEANLQVKAELSWMKGKAAAYTHMYAGALVGYNAGELYDCRVNRMTYVKLDVPVDENTTDSWKASLYTIEVGYYNYSTLNGVAGVIGSSDKSAVAKNITTL